MQAGEFDRLAGRGKPLNLEENPFEPEGWGSAFRLIRQNGYSLPWIEAGLEIKRQRLQAHRMLRDARRDSDPGAYRRELEVFAGRIAALNREINQYNLRVPAAVFQRRTLNVETERAAALNSPAAETQTQD